MFTVTFHDDHGNTIDWHGPFPTGQAAEAHADNVRNNSIQITGWTIERI